MIVNMIIYIYFSILVLILIYTIAYIFHNMYKERQDKQEVLKWKSMIHKQILLISKEKKMEKHFFIEIGKVLKNGIKLLNFHHALKSFNLDEEEYDIFLIELEGYILDASKYYGTRDAMEKAYFAHFYSRFSSGRWINEQFQYIFLDYLTDSDVYVRESVVQAIVSSGREEWVLRMFEEYTNQNWFHHPKLIGDGLFKFPGDQEKLARKLWTNRKKLSLSINLGIMQFLSLTSKNYQVEMLETLRDEKEDIEIRLSAIRYLQKYPYQPAEEILFEYLFNQNHTYQLRVVAARALRCYDSKESIEVLKRGLSDPNWYVRLNASESLTELKVNLMDLKDILIGADQYAKEIVLYRLSSRR